MKTIYGYGSLALYDNIRLKKWISQYQHSFGKEFLQFLGRILNKEKTLKGDFPF